MTSITDKNRINQIYKLMRGGDSRCPHKIGDRVEKVTIEEDDLTPDGEKGTVVGSIWLEDNTEGLEDSYLVKYDNRSKDEVIFCIGLKLKELKDEQ